MLDSSLLFFLFSVCVFFVVVVFLFVYCAIIEFVENSLCVCFFLHFKFSIIKYTQPFQWKADNALIFLFTHLIQFRIECVNAYGSGSRDVRFTKYNVYLRLHTLWFKGKYTHFDNADDNDSVHTNNNNNENKSNNKRINTTFRLFVCFYF